MRGPVGMVGDGAEVEHKRSYVRSHIKQGEYTVKYDELSDGRHLDVSCLQSFEQKLSSLSSWSNTV